MGRKRHAAAVALTTPLRGAVCDVAAPGTACGAPHSSAMQPAAAWVQLACTALDAASCARLARASPALRDVVTSLVEEERVLGGLVGSVLLGDMLATARGDRPLLALSHLESLAHAALLFDAARDLLRALQPRGGAGTLLEVPGGTVDLCCALVGQFLCYTEQGGELVRASAVARVGALLYFFEAPVQWSSGLLRAFREWSRGSTATVVALHGRGGSLSKLLHGIPHLLPATRLASDVRAGHADVAMLLCQVLERLVFPLRSARLVLRVSFPVAEDNIPGVGSSPAQSSAFVHTLRALEKEASLPSTVGSLDLWVVEAAGRHYVVSLEGWPSV